jgi:hypothetical protein
MGLYGLLRGQIYITLLYVSRQIPCSWCKCCYWIADLPSKVNIRTACGIIKLGAEPGNTITVMNLLCVFLRKCNCCTLHCTSQCSRSRPRSLLMMFPSMRDHSEVAVCCCVRCTASSMFPLQFWGTRSSVVVDALRYKPKGQRSRPDGVTGFHQFT